MFALLMFVAGVATFFLAAYVWLQGAKPAVRTFALLLAAIALWLICISGWSFAPSVAAARVWFWLQFLGVGAVPVLLLSYVLHFTGRARALTPYARLALWTIPALTQAFAWTNDAHQLMFRSITFVRHDGLFVLESWAAGLWFALYAAYSFGIVAAAMVLMARAAIGSPDIFRRQLLALLVAVIPAFGLTLLNALQLLPATLWLTPMAFMLTGATVVWAIVSQQMIAVVPVARDMLIEQMDDAMLVIDDRERVVDLNPAMEALLGRGRGDLLSRPFADALATLPELLAGARTIGASPVELELAARGEARTYEMAARALLHRGSATGRLLLLRDITRMKQAQSELFLLATTDTLTGLYNRRQFFTLAEPQVEIAARSQRPLAVLLFDIDNFKQVNDRYGHAAGDQALVTVALRARGITRSIDIICRYGGEEFVILLVEAGATQAALVAERLRTAIAEAPVPVGDERVTITVSVGVAIRTPAAQPTLDDLLRLADVAMYQAKQTGRNRVELVG